MSLSFSVNMNRFIPENSGFVHDAAFITKKQHLSIFPSSVCESSLLFHPSVNGLGIGSLQ